MNIQNIFGAHAITTSGDMANVTYKDNNFIVFANKSDNPNILYLHVIAPPQADKDIFREFIVNVQERMNKRKHAVHMRIYHGGTVGFWGNNWRK